MKKILLAAVIAVCISSSAAAVETKYESFGFNFSVPVLYESQKEDGVEVETTMTSIAFGIQALSLYTERLGLYVNLDLVLPQNISIKIGSGKLGYTIDMDRSDYDSLWGMSALLGPAICITQSDKMLFTVSPGIHYSLLSAEVEGNSSVVYLFGLGANIQDSIFFSDSGYFSFGADIAYDFYGVNISGGESKSETSHDFTFTPRVGIGFRFK